MTSESKTLTDSDRTDELLGRYSSEDPRREPHEKETNLHLEGDSTHCSVTSFKKVVYTKLIRRPRFSVTRLHVLNDDGQERTVDTLKEAAEQSLTIIGVTGRLPVGAVNIGTPRNSNSHADLVK